MSVENVLGESHFKVVSFLTLRGTVAVDMKIALISHDSHLTSIVFYYNVVFFLVTAANDLTGYRHFRLT